MNYKLRKIITNARVIILLVFILFALVAINPRPVADGVAISNILTNSSASDAGMQAPPPTTRPVDRTRITAVNGQDVSSVEDYFRITAELSPNTTIHISTSDGPVRLRTRPVLEAIETDQVEEQIIQIVEYDNRTINGTVVTTNSTVNQTIEVPVVKYNVIGTEDLGIRIVAAPKTNIKKGLDLSGGTRVLLQPEQLLTPEDMASLIDVMEERLNVYGLSDVVIRTASDLPTYLGGSDRQFIVVEIAGATEEEIRALLAQQGKFDARIDNQTVFNGGEDVVFVCRSPDCSGIDPQIGCFQTGGTAYQCQFSFSITLTQQAAQAQAEATAALEVIEAPSGAYLSSPLELFLDNFKVDELNIAAALKGSPTTDIQISGSGVGASIDEAAFVALNNMRELQTILITGSLPVSLEIVKVDSVSPLLGEEFLQNAIFAGLLAILVVGIIVFLRYRRFAVALPLVTTALSEVLLLLGFAALIGWNIDLAAVAGIIIAVGTGVDHQIVIADETLKGKKSNYSWREQIKKAFFIIMASYFTVVVAMFPLLFAGAGLLKGFAITTIVGASMGVFVTRPVFAKVVEILLR